MLLNKNFKWLKAGAEAGEKNPETGSTTLLIDTDIGTGFHSLPSA